jgi:hypothetical protein
VGAANVAWNQAFVAGEKALRGSAFPIAASYGEGETKEEKLGPCAIVRSGGKDVLSTGY